MNWDEYADKLNAMTLDELSAYIQEHHPAPVARMPKAWDNCHFCGQCIDPNHPEWITKIDLDHGYTNAHTSCEVFASAGYQIEYHTEARS